MIMVLLLAFVKVVLPVPEIVNVELEKVLELMVPNCTVV